MRDLRGERSESEGMGGQREYWEQVIAKTDSRILAASAAHRIRGLCGRDVRYWVSARTGTPIESVGYRPNTGYLLWDRCERRYQGLFNGPRPRIREERVGRD